MIRRRPFHSIIDDYRILDTRYKSAGDVSIRAIRISSRVSLRGLRALEHNEISNQRNVLSQREKCPRVKSQIPIDLECDD